MGCGRKPLYTLCAASKTKPERVFQMYSRDSPFNENVNALSTTRILSHNDHRAQNCTLL